jgi:hypothetical protein
MEKLNYLETERLKIRVASLALILEMLKKQELYMSLKLLNPRRKITDEENEEYNDLTDVIEELENFYNMQLEKLGN